MMTIIIKRKVRIIIMIVIMLMMMMLIMIMMISFSAALSDVAHETVLSKYRCKNNVKHSHF